MLGLSHAFLLVEDGEPGAHGNALASGAHDSLARGKDLLQRVLLILERRLQLKLLVNSLDLIQRGLQGEAELVHFASVNLKEVLAAESARKPL